MLGSAGDGVFAIRGDGRIALWNRVAERILGYAAREAMGRRCCEIFAGFDGDGNRLCYEGCHVQSLLRMGEPVQSFDMRTRTRGGRSVWLNVSVLSMHDADGEKVAVHLFRDVTATKELLRLVHERLSAALPAHGEPAAVLSRREIDVLRLMVEGLNTAAAATRLHVSRSTIRNHGQRPLRRRRHPLSRVTALPEAAPSPRVRWTVRRLSLPRRVWGLPRARVRRLRRPVRRRSPLSA